MIIIYDCNEQLLICVFLSQVINLFDKHHVKVFGAVVITFYYSFLLLYIIIITRH